MQTKISVYVLLLQSVFGFLAGDGMRHPRQASFGLSTRFPIAPVKSKSSDTPWDEKEVKEMEDLILSLSLEPTDESRRERVKSIFQTELAKPNGAPKHFSDLFDFTLVIVGDRVKAEAQENAERLQSMETTETVSDEKSTTSQGFPEQRQLWSLVDMMVQSKTIVKRASGDLGSKGSFQ